VATRTIEMVMVGWLRSTTDAASEGDCQVGGRHYTKARPASRSR